MEGAAQVCGVCGTSHSGAGCPTLIRAIGAIDRTADLAPAEGLPDPQIGRVVCDYELASVLGMGSFGVVYRAVHVKTHEEVALKLMHAHLVDDAEAVRRFVGEARATLLVSHDNVVSIKTIDRCESSRYFLVLELLQGETLEERCQRGAIPFEEAAPLLRQMCDALEAAHAVGVVHRDLKPENIYLQRREHRVSVKVMDFGMAHRTHLASGEKRTRHGLVIGTPQYLSPEQSLGIDVDQRTDIYSLGVIMFRMLTGRLPFTHTNATSLILAHRLEEPPAPSKVKPELPRELDPLVLKALLKDPSKRYQTMAAFESAIFSVEAELRARRPAVHPERLLLDGIEGVPLDDHYQLFDVREGASVETIAAAAARLLERLERARKEADPEAQRRIDAAIERVTRAREVLTTPRSRVAWDATKGNFVGVARMISAGFDLRMLNALRELFLLDHPELETQAPYPEVPDSVLDEGADGVAVTLARRLREDPLNLELHRRYWPLRNAIKKKYGSVAQTLPA